jgi:hypothetical protein
MNEPLHHHVSKHFGVHRTAGNEGVTHHANGLAGVGHFGGYELIESAGDFIGHGMQHACAFVGTHRTAAPSGRFECMAALESTVAFEIDGTTHRFATWSDMSALYAVRYLAKHDRPRRVAKWVNAVPVNQP